MITDNEKVKKEVKDIIDNKVVSWGFLKWLNNKEREIREDIINYIIMLLIGKENKFIMTVIFLIFRKEIREIVNDTKTVTKEKLLDLIDKIKAYYQAKKK